MTTVALILVWCAAGLSGLYFGGVGPAGGFAALADRLFAATLGPFSFLISFLATQTLPETDLEDASAGFIRDPKA